MSENTGLTPFEAAAAKVGEEASAGSATPGEGEAKKSRGRPKGYSPVKARLEALANAPKPVPPVNEDEAKMFAQALCGVARLFIKDPYKERISFTEEELLTVTRPLVQLKDYYMPGFAGIYSTWTQLGLAAAGIAFAKYQIIQAIIKEEKDKAPIDTASAPLPDNGKKDTASNGHEGNG